jgi:3-hydroxybutyryl-CoA dehydrogenase
MREVKTIAVVGAGPAGRTLARLSALAGYRTVLEDVIPGSLSRAQNEISAAIDAAVNAGSIGRGEADAALARIEYANSIEGAAREAELVFEAVPDEMESKLEIFSLLDRVCLPNTVIASNARSLTIDDCASMTYRRQNIVGMYIDDACTSARIVCGSETDQATLDAALAVARRMVREVSCESRQGAASA